MTFSPDSVSGSPPKAGLGSVSGFATSRSFHKTSFFKRVFTPGTSGSGIDVRLMSGSQAACLAPWIWSAMTPRLRSVMLYDVSPKARARIFPEALRRSSVAGVAWDDGELAAVSWIEPLFPEARCGVIHFCFIRPKRAERIARKFLALVAESRRFDTLMAFLPALYRHARAFAKRVGFEELGVFAGACRLAEPERVAGGALLRLEFGN